MDDVGENGVLLAGTGFLDEVVQVLMMAHGLFYRVPSPTFQQS
jgi:hypothetical protein